MQRERLHDDYIEGLAPAETRYEVYDDKVKNLAIRIGARQECFVG
ncbi:hypothetical protein [Rhizobium sp. BK068]|nr:hypothetical protein [Rhizobium sp. BK068]TCM74965.1 hypothetical protein EV291_11645 [Rhizobium sp. BK068]